MFEILNTIMMIVGYVVSILAVLIALLFIESPKSDAETHFAWLPTYVAIWNKNYTKHKFVWLRYYFRTSSDPKYFGLDGSQAPKSLNYIIRSERSSLLA